MSKRVKKEDLNENGTHMELDIFDYSKIPTPIVCMIVNMLPEDMNTLTSFSKTCRMNSVLSVKRINIFRIKFRSQMDQKYSHATNGLVACCSVLADGEYEEEYTKEFAEYPPDSIFMDIRKMIYSNAFDINCSLQLHDDDVNSDSLYCCQDCIPLHLLMCTNNVPDDLIQLLLFHPLRDHKINPAPMWELLYRKQFDNVWNRGESDSVSARLKFDESWVLRCFESLTFSSADCFDINACYKDIENDECNLLYYAIRYHHCNVVKAIINHQTFTFDKQKYLQNEFDFNFQLDFTYIFSGLDNENSLNHPGPKIKTIQVELGLYNVNNANVELNSQLKTLRDWAFMVKRNDIVELIDEKLKTMSL